MQESPLEEVGVPLEVFGMGMGDERAGIIDQQLLGAATEVAQRDIQGFEDGDPGFV